MSHIDSHEAMLRQVPLATAAVGWQTLPHRSPLHRHPAVPPAPLAGWPGAIKRATDIAVALLTLGVHIPLLLAVAIAIKLDSRGPVLFLQRRIGVNGQAFALLKFRTMQHQPPAAESLAPGSPIPLWPTPGAAAFPLRQTCPHDPRVTRVGALLRRTSLDELPQLWNVLRGEMSLVGPRPHAPGTCAGGTPFEQVSDRYALRHRVRPGMTGLAQVRGWRGQTDTEEKLLRRLDSDLEYIAAWSLWLDCIILARTVATVLRMRNAY